MFTKICSWHGSCSVYTTMFIKRIFQIGLVAIIASALTTVEARPKPDKEKPKKERPEKGEKKWDRDKVKERLKAAFDKRRKNRGDAKKKGHKVHHRGHVFGKLVRDDAKIKEVREAFDTEAKKRWEGFDRKAWKDATDEEKAALREKLAEGRKEWADKVKAHREEVKKRLEEIRAEFKNKRDKVIDGNNPND